MTVSSTISRVSYSGNGSTTAFAVSFYFLENTHLKVILRAADGTETVKALTTDYTVSGAGNPAGGTVTMNTAPASGTTLVIVRNVPLTQETDYQANDPFPAESHERALDKLTMEVQQQQLQLDRSIKVPATTPTNVSTELPDPQANKFIGWNESANGLQNIDASTLVTIAAYGTARSDVFTGDGVQTAFTLSYNPGSLNNLDVSIDGATQVNGVDFTWTSGTTLTMTTAVPNRSKLLVRYMQGLPTTTADADDVQYAPSGMGARTVGAKLRETVSVKDFGAVGDGVTDDTAAIQAALSFLTTLGGGYLYFGNKETYLITDELSVTNSIELNLNGSTLNFACVGPKRLLAVDGSNVTILNGTVNNTVGTPGLQGTFQTPITVAQSQYLSGVSNVVIRNLTISTVTPQGNGIGIFGDSSDILVENIVFPDSAYIGIPILAHWSLDESKTGSPYTGTTTHPHNITINNISCGNLTYGSGYNFGTSVVFISACYNVKVSNIYVKSIPWGKICTIYAGDWGFQFASALEKELGMSGVSVSNLYGKALVGLETYLLNPLEATQKIWPASISVKNANVVSYGDTSTAAKGINIDVTDNVSVEDCVFVNGYYGVFLGAATNTKIKNSIIKNSRRQGLIKFGTGASTNVEIANNRFENNNVDGAINIGDILLQEMSQVSVYENIFDSVKAHYSLEVLNTTTGFRCLNNHVANVNVTYGPCFLIASQLDTYTCIEFQGNTSAVSPANGIRSGQLMVPVVFSARHSQNTLQRIAYDNQKPDRGTWAVGDIIYKENVIVGQALGWYCTTAGTPGTWVELGQVGVLSTIDLPPEFVGQTAVVAGDAYIGIGTSASTDWKKITP